MMLIEKSIKLDFIIFKANFLLTFENYLIRSKVDFLLPFLKIYRQKNVVSNH